MKPDASRRSGRTGGGLRRSWCWWSLSRKEQRHSSPLTPTSARSADESAALLLLRLVRHWGWEEERLANGRKNRAPCPPRRPWTSPRITWLRLRTTRLFWTRSHGRGRPPAPDLQLSVPSALGPGGGASPVAARPPPLHRVCGAARGGGGP